MTQSINFKAASFIFSQVHGTLNNWVALIAEDMMVLQQCVNSQFPQRQETEKEPALLCKAPAKIKVWTFCEKIQNFKLYFPDPRQLSNPTRLLLRPVVLGGGASGWVQAVLARPESGASVIKLFFVIDYPGKISYECSSVFSIFSLELS
jgi:hypothetical protein